MGALSDYAEVELLKLLTGQALALTTPVTPYVALFTVAPSETGGGTEVTGGGYARVNASGKFAAPTSGAGSTSNNAVLDFGTTTAGWGAVVAVGIFTASTGGQLLTYGLLNPQRTVNSGDPVSFGVGTLQLALD